MAAVVRIEMASRHQTPEALADVLGVAEPAVARRLLDGETPFDLVEIERVAAWLGVAPSELLARADERAASGTTPTTRKGRVMHARQPHSSTRAGLGILIASIVVSMLSLTSAPAHATPDVTAAHASYAESRACGPTVNQRVADRCADTGPQQFSEGGCGFLQRCVYFNRTEQTYLISGSKWIVQAALCAASIGLGCVAAGLIVEIAAQWLLSRGGICPTSKPKLRVQWFPNPQVEGCVA